jgi:hypothetical protein
MRAFSTRAMAAVLVGAVAAVLSAWRPGRVSSAPPVYEPGTVVRLPRGAAARVPGLSLARARTTDYGSFVRMEVSPAELQSLIAAEVPFEVEPSAGRIHIGGRTFDPLREGPPEAPSALRAEPDGPGLWLVQLQGPARDEWIAEMTARGVRLLQYYPHDTYLVWDGGARTRVAAVPAPYVRWEGAFQPAYKLPEELARRTGPIRNLDVMIFDDGDVEGVLARLRDFGANVLHSHPTQPDRAFFETIVEIDAAALPEVAAIPTVVWMGVVSPRPALTDERSDQIVAGRLSGGRPVPGYRDVLAQLGYTGRGVTWAVIDEGVDYDHPALASHIVGGHEFPGACNIPGQPGSDCRGGGHGTHVAGIIGGDGAPGFTDPDGFLYGLGIAPEYGIFAMNSVRVFRPWPPAGGWQEHSKRAVLGGAVGGNNSWTTGDPDAHGYQLVERTHDLMVRDGNFDTTDVAEPFIEVFAAGNSGSGAYSINPPGEAKNLIVVANSGNDREGSGPIDALSIYSSRGPAVDGRLLPTVAAPGQEIASTANDEGGVCTTPIAGTNGLFAYCTGTSMAAPHVSGVATLLTQWWKETNGGRVPSPALVKAVLVNSAVDMGAPDIPNVNEGWGRVDVGRAIRPGVPRHIADQEHTFGATGEVETLNISVADCRNPLKVTLVWTDAPGAPGANPALVNDLDLTVLTNGGVYHGNVFERGVSKRGGAADRLNNVESVYVANPGSSAVVTIAAAAIRADGVPYNADFSDQDYALVCSNCVVRRGPVVAVTRLGSATASCTVTSSPAGIHCGERCAARFTPGRTVTLKANGSAFAGWGGACTGTSRTCRVTANGHVGVTTRCDLPPQTLTVVPVGSGRGTITSTPAGIDCGPTCVATFDGGALVGLSAAPDGESRFTGWGGDCSGQRFCQVAMNTPRSVRATFEACVYTPIVPGQTLSGALADIDCFARQRAESFADRYTFAGTAGQRIVITQSATEYATFVYLFGPGGDLLASNGGRSTSRLPATGFFTLPATGVYTIDASSRDARAIGSYTIRLD